MSTFSKAHLKERRILTRDAAAALIEDLAYIRDMCNRAQPSSSELRRLSGLLRRILVDKDLELVGSPRIGRVKIDQPDNNSILKALERTSIPLFVSGGAQAFGMTMRGLHVFSAESSPIDATFDPDRTVAVRLDNFLAQRVLCFMDEWASRRDIIKYIANFASGVHTNTPREPADLLVARARKACHITRHRGVFINMAALRDAEPPFRYDLNSVDIALIELMASASYLVNSSDVIHLEDIIARELGVNN